MRPGSGVTTSVFRRRLPFLGIFLSATAGILLSSQLAFGSPVFLWLSLGALAVWAVMRREAVLHAAIAFAFASAHAQQTRDSPAMRLAEFIGPDPEVVSIRGRVVDEPESAGTRGCRFELRVSELTSGGTRWRVPFDLMVEFNGPPPAAGDLVEARGSMAPLPTPRNPGEFDLRSYLALRGIHNRLGVPTEADLEIVAAGSPYSLQRIANACRGWMERTLSAGISDQPLSCALLAGIVLGNTSELPESLEGQFRDTGTYHLFSVSGLHVGMIALILWQIAKTLGLGRREAVFLVVPALFFYALVTGWKPASIRAATMATIFLAGMLSSRKPVALNSLCAAGTAILILSTNELFNPGFQFSFSVVLAIILVAGPLQSMLRRRMEPDVFLPVAVWGPLDRARHAIAGRLAALLAVSFAAWLGSLPLTAVYFHMVSLAALLANPIAVPLAFAVMVTAMLSLLGGLAAAWIASVFNNANLVFTHALLAIVHFTAGIPFATIPLAAPSGPLRVTVFDFGRGGCAAIESGGKLWMLDGGSEWNARSTLVPWMRSVGRRGPDGIVLSHGDAAHLGGIRTLLAESRHPEVVESVAGDSSSTRKALQQYLESTGIPRSVHSEGDRLSLSPAASLAVLHPPSPPPAGISDDKALVVRLDAENARILFLSDAGPAVWERLAGSGDLRADVLVLGRHRSGQLPEAGFLRLVSPRAVVVTGAGFPREEKVDEEWEAMVRGLGIEVFRQDVTGAVQITTGEDGVELRAFLDGVR